MLMILSKLYQGYKEKIAGWSASVFHYMQKLHRGETCFCVQYICEIRSRLANRAAARFSWEEQAKSPFVIATVKKTLFLTSEISRRSVVCARPDQTLLS